MLLTRSSRLHGMTDAEIACFEADVVKICTEHAKRHWHEYRSYRQCVSFDSKGTKYFIKFDRPCRLWPEFSTQSYIHDCAVRQGDGPRIAQPLHYFEHSDRERAHEAYFVMEYIHLRGEPPADLAERTADVLNWLSKVPSPAEDLLGPIGGGRIRHRFFKDHEAPLEFSHVDALERYMNKGIQRLPKRGANSLKPMKITNDPLIFIQSDMDISNFAVDECGNMVLYDFGSIGRSPLSFAIKTVGRGEGDSFRSQVARLLHWTYDEVIISNLYSMARVSACLWMTADATLGLDNDGFPVSKVKPKEHGTVSV